MAGYGTDEAFTAWAADNGLTVPDGSVTAARQRGSAYIDGRYEARFPGTRTGGYSQERSWPRTGAETFYGEAIPSNVIPDPIIWASYTAAFQELTSPGSLAPVIIGSATVKREKVGPLETEYAVATTQADIVAMSTPVVTAIEGLLWQFLYQPMPAILVV
jgi:hypothetical protein